MSSSLDAVFASWPPRPWLAAGLLLTLLVYARGWRKLRWRRSQLAAFTGGLATIYIALASPIEPFASLLLQVHMLQHLLLTMVAPPLIWLGSPMMPLLRGMPTEVRRYWIAPLLRSPALRQLTSFITHPVAAWTLFVLVTWLWHVPRFYEAALANDGWHVAQHLCFLIAGLIFWYPVVRPYPARPSWSLWLLAPYLLLADVQNTVLSALFTFSDRVLYSHYLSMPRLGSLSALDDQSAAGVLMWVPGSVAFLAPLAWIGVRLMRSAECGMRSISARPTLRTPHSAPRTSMFDVLRLPLIGSLLRNRATRRIVQFIVLLAAIAVIVDGLSGPQVSAMNLAGVAPWIHWRGFVILGLLAAGNLFCYACPFMLPRSIARRWLPAGRTWPRWLRSKWLAVALVALFLWSYEAFALWDNPWLTAWIAIAYFVGALVIDGLFRDAAFCKYVCPIGQFHFVQSLVSPLEVRVREPAVCTTCQTRDCIRGRGNVPGCELNLFQPRKVGNLDCTFCLDCVQACPTANVGVLPVLPLTSLWRDGPRSGIGRLSRRVDYAALAALLVFGAFANAAGMVAPIVASIESLSQSLNMSTFVLITAFYMLCLFAVPLLCVTLTTAASQSFALSSVSPRDLACRFTWSLVPIGFAMWLAHYSFHFFTSFDTIVPVAHRFAADLGLAPGGGENWTMACCLPTPDWLLKAEIVMLDFGLLGSLYAAWRVGQSMAKSPRATFAVCAPWVVLIVLLFAAGIWILLQPMQMRGTLTG